MGGVVGLAGGGEDAVEEKWRGLVQGLLEREAGAVEGVGLHEAADCV